MKHSLNEFVDLKNVDEKETVIKVTEVKNGYSHKSDRKA